MVETELGDVEPVRAVTRFEDEIVRGAAFEFDDRGNKRKSVSGDRDDTRGGASGRRGPVRNGDERENGEN